MLAFAQVWIGGLKKLDRVTTTTAIKTKPQAAESSRDTIAEPLWDARRSTNDQSRKAVNDAVGEAHLA